MESLESRFENNPRRKQEMRGRPIADAIYRSVLGDDINITRFENNYILDKEFAIDVQVSLPSGLILLGQEKFLSFERSGFRSVTVEYMQNPVTGEKGDWFKLGVQFYFVGYFTASGNDFYPWIMLHWPAVVLMTHSGSIKWIDQVNKDGKAKASLRYAFMDGLPKICVIASRLVDN